MFHRNVSRFQFKCMLLLTLDFVQFIIIFLLGFVQFIVEHNRI